MSKSQSLHPKVALREMIARHSQAISHDSRPPIHREIYAHVVDQIRRGAWSLGEKIVEANLAERFDVSIIGVRAATERLIAEGWVERVPNKGLFVKDYSLEQIKSIYGVREMFDAEAARIVTPAIADEHLDELSRLNRVIEEAVLKEDFHSARDADTHFHRLLVHFTGNPKLEEMFESVVLMTLGSLLPMEDELPYDVEATRKILSVAGHKLICSALAKRAPDLAEQVAREHVRAACQSSVKLYKYRRQRRSESSSGA